MRVVEAATGKDLTDHLQCGHEIGELCPIPVLDPYTRPTARSGPAEAGPQQSQTTEHRAAETDPVSAASSPHPGGTEDMSRYMMAPDLDDAPADNTADIEHAGAQLSMFWKLLLNQLLAYAQKLAEQRRKDLETLAEREDAQREADEARMAAERKAVETRLKAMQDAGWHTASREELAAAITDARAWAPDSETAKDS
ncbi:hypothetical protein ABZ413_17195 [Nocardia rhamnosiphila]|uniref:hypothetical protein n=1 Tax=Nocardia rhamnosiphila TaxID=426716 RepID=UPI00340C7A5F